MTESKKYITSKSKTFKEGSELPDIVMWLEDNIEGEAVKKDYDILRVQSKQKYKITITNLK